MFLLNGAESNENEINLWHRGINSSSYSSLIAFLGWAGLGRRLRGRLRGRSRGMTRGRPRDKPRDRPRISLWGKPGGGCRPMGLDRLLS